MSGDQGKANKILNLSVRPNKLTESKAGHPAGKLLLAFSMFIYYCARKWGIGLLP